MNFLIFYGFFPLSKGLVVCLNDEFLSVQVAFYPAWSYVLLDTTVIFHISRNFLVLGGGGADGTLPFSQQTFNYPNRN